MTKTYQSIRFSELHLTILVPSGKEKKKTNIDFIGGSTYPLKSNGTYTTRDSDIQKALEKSPEFNKSYRLLFKEGKAVFKEESQLTVEEKLEAANKLNTLLSQQIANFKGGEDNPLAGDLEDANDTIETLDKIVEEQKLLLSEKDNEIAVLKQKAADEKVVEEKPEVEIEKAEGPINMQAARKYLITKHGQDIKEMKNGVQVLNVAKKLGVEFPNWHPSKA